MAARRIVAPPGCIFPRELSKRIGVRTQTLAKWRSGQPGRPQRGPAYIRAFGMIFYREVDVESWLASLLESRRVVPGEAKRSRRRAA